MRVLSLFDKHIITTIVAIQKPNKTLLIEDLLANILPEEYEAKIWHDRKVPTTETGIRQFRLLVKHREEFREEITDMVRQELYLINDIIDFLLSNGFLSVLGFHSFTEVIINKIEADDTDYSTVLIMNDNASYNLFSRLFSRLLVNESLVDLVKHKFVYAEDRHNQRSRMISVVSALIAAFALVAPFFREAPKQTHVHQVIIDSSFINKLIQAEKNITSKDSSIVLDTSPRFKTKKVRNK